MEFSKLNSKLLSAVSLALASQALFGCLSPNNKSRLAADSLVSDNGQYDTSATFYVDSVHGGETAGVSTDSWGFPKEKIFNFSVCLRDIAAMSPIIDQPFVVTDGQGVAKCVTGGGKSGACRTDASGCLVWQENHSFDYLAPETFVPMPRIVKAQGVHNGSVRMNLALDPWRTGGDSLVDLRINSVPQLSVSKVTSFSSYLDLPSAPAAVLNLKSLSLEFLGMDYSSYHVDRRLTLSVAHSYRLRMSPTIFRKGLSQEQISENPNKGQMRVTLVILRSLKPGVYPEASDVLAEVQKDIEFQGDIAIGDVTLAFQDLAALTTRAYALVEVQPLIESPSLGSVRFEGPIGPLPSASGAQLVSTNFSAVSLRNSYIAQQGSSTPLSSEQVLEKYAGLKPLPLSATEGQEFLSFASMDRNQQQILLQKVCAAAYPKAHESFMGQLSSTWLPASVSRRSEETALAFCLRSPLSALKVMSRDLVEDVNSPTPARVGVPQNENLSVSIGFSKSVVDSLSTGSSTNLSLSGNASAGASLDTASVAPASPLDAKVGVSVSYGAQVFRATSHTKSTTAMANVSESHSIALVAEGNTFALDVTARHCAVVVPDSSQTGYRADQSFPGYYFCAASTQRKNVLETYYLITQTNRIQGSPFTDSNDPGEMPFQVFIRGNAAYTRFKALVADPQTELLLENPPKVSESLIPDGLDLRMTQDFPGLLDN